MLCGCISCSYIHTSPALSGTWEQWVITLVATLHVCLVSRVRLSRRGRESGQFPIICLVSNTPRISLRINCVSDKWSLVVAFFGVLSKRARRPTFAERVPIYVHTLLH